MFRLRNKKICFSIHTLNLSLAICNTGVGELPAMLTADCRVKFRSDLISLRWYLPSATYLGDKLSAVAWKKFRELLPVFTSRHLSYKTSGHVYSSCRLSAMLYAVKFGR